MALQMFLWHLGIQLQAPCQNLPEQEPAFVFQVLQRCEPPAYQKALRRAFREDEGHDLMSEAPSSQPQRDSPPTHAEDLMKSSSTSVALENSSSFVFVSVVSVVALQWTC